MPSFLCSYFRCQTFSVSRRALDPVRILTDPGWFSGSRASMERHKKLKIQKRGLANYLENLLNGILNISHRSGPRAKDPYPDPHPCCGHTAIHMKILVKIRITEIVIWASAFWERIDQMKFMLIKIYQYF